MLEILKTILDFLIFTVFVKYIVAKYIAKWMVKIFKWFFVRTDKQVTVYVHNLNRARGHGHLPELAIDCNEGKCALI